MQRPVWKAIAIPGLLPSIVSITIIKDWLTVMSLQFEVFWLLISLLYAVTVYAIVVPIFPEKEDKRIGVETEAKSSRLRRHLLHR